MNKQKKGLLSLLLSVCLLLSLSVAAWAEQQEAGQRLNISSLEDFLAFAENCRLDSFSEALTVELTCDIDLSEEDFVQIPYFGGNFYGNGHVITGLRIEGEGSEQGLFRYLNSKAEVYDLRVEGTVTPSGSRSCVGGLAGVNWGLIRNCQFVGTVSGKDYVGGITGRNAVTGVLEDCRSEGTVNGTHFVGGLAGENQGVIRDCVNQAEVNTTAEQNQVVLSEVSVENLTDTESVSASTDIGGISGGNTGMIRGCSNQAPVGYRQMGYNIGGISGSQSGYITDCVNYAAVNGRKEVGGIVGHMEPAALISFETDTLQTLEGQVNALAGLTQQMSYDARNSSAQISSQMTALEEQVATIQTALRQLLPTPEDPSLPDLDSLLAAQNALSGSLSAMGGTIEGLVNATKNTVGTLANDIQSISGQIGAIGGTLGASSENMGGSVDDISDADSAEDTTGKVSGCVNYGTVLADLNGGGIAGAMALENDLDPEDDVDISGNTSLNFTGEMRVVLLDCENHGEVTVNKRRGGGIVGWQPMGLVKECVNSGTVSAESAEYVGGIAGESGGYLRTCQVKCAITGDSYTGGVTGLGVCVTDCLSMVSLGSGGERFGEVLGYAESRENILNNYYLPVGKDLGAVDGISYSGCAQPQNRENFLAREGASELFQTARVRFCYEDGSFEVFSVPTGGVFSPEDIPTLPEKTGYTSCWTGLEEADLTQITFDLTFYGEYIPLDVVIESDACRENGLPILLAEGGYYNGETISLQASNACPSDKTEQFLEGWTLIFPDEAGERTLHYLLPEGQNGEEVEIWLRSSDGSWRNTTFTQEGSYLIFPFEADDAGFALIYAPGIKTWMILAACGGIGVITVSGLLIRKRVKRSKEKQTV